VSQVVFIFLFFSTGTLDILSERALLHTCCKGNVESCVMHCLHHGYLIVSMNAHDTRTNLTSFPRGYVSLYCFVIVPREHLDKYHS
jgi:hypothetical protein